MERISRGRDRPHRTVLVQLLDFRRLREIVLLRGKALQADLRQVRLQMVDLCQVNLRSHITKLIYISNFLTLANDATLTSFITG